MATLPPLAHLRVLDLSTTVVGAYAGTLLAQYGAVVTMVEPPEGSPVRRVPPLLGDAATDPDCADLGTLYLFLGAGKRSVVLDIESERGRAALDALIRDADVVIDTHQRKEQGALHLDWETVSAINPGVVMVSITPFGLSGPYADYQATALQLSAAAGWLMQNGEPGREPLMVDSFTLHEFFPGGYGAIAALAGVRAAREQGTGQLMEISSFEALHFASRYYEASFHATGQVITRAGDSLGNSPTYRVYPSTDGHVVTTASTSTQIEMLMTLTESDHLGLGSRANRYERADELVGSMRKWFAQRTRAEGFHAAQEWRIPVAMVSRISEVAELEQARARGIFAEIDHPATGKRSYPGALAPLRGGFRVTAPAPTLGQHTEEVFDGLARDGERVPPPAASPDSTRPLPLAGVRVLDLTNWFAGPTAGQLLADLGAEVIKIEAIQKLDPWRGIGAALVDGTKAGPETYETSPLFVAVNRNKKGMTLNLKSPAGRELFERLVEVSDVVLENYSPRVMEQFGLDYERLRELNPKVVLTSLSGFGHSGPWRDYVSFAAVAESLGGVTRLLAYDGEGPLIVGAMPSDPAGGLAAVLGTMGALEVAARTGEGQHVDIAQLEATVPLLADALMEWALLGRERSGSTNRSASFAPHGVYRAAGQDRWISLSVATEEQWRGFCAALGNPTWAQEQRFATLEGRLANREALDEHVRGWTTEQDGDAITELLQHHGVAAMPVLDAEHTLQDRHLVARGHFQTINRSYAADYPGPTPPIRPHGKRIDFYRPTPLLGEHNGEILKGLLGLSDERVRALEAEGVIGSQPIWRDGDRD